VLRVVRAGALAARGNVGLELHDRGICRDAQCGSQQFVLARCTTRGIVIDARAADSSRNRWAATAATTTTTAIRMVIPEASGSIPVGVSITVMVTSSVTIVSRTVTRRVTVSHTNVTRISSAHHTRVVSGCRSLV